MCRGIAAEIVPDPEKFCFDEEFVRGKIPPDTEHGWLPERSKALDREVHPEEKRY